MSHQYTLQEAKGDAVCFVPGSPLFSVLMEPASFCYPQLTFLRSPYGQFGASAGSSQDLAPWPQRLVPQRWSRPVDGVEVRWGEEMQGWCVRQLEQNGLSLAVSSAQPEPIAAERGQGAETLDVKSQSPPAAMSRNGYFFEESGKYYLTFLHTHLVGGRAALQG
ncbi:sodium bicarbonate transporter-like protein 11 [Turdus rufiventris]|nr:sodium bicarbonate transporter-like protein 11 [Turdus rufiventris]